MKNGFETYKKTHVYTASREQVLIMLYQAAIKNCKKSIEAIESDNVAKKGEYIGKMQDIVIELNNSLDFKVGKEVADRLSGLYDYILFSSTQANIKIDKRPLEECLKILTTLYEGWAEAIKKLRKSNK